jgi:hypothetical protein
VINTEEFFTFGFNKWDVWIQSYFGDVYLPWRTLIIVGIIFLGFKIKSRLKKESVA